MYKYILGGNRHDAPPANDLQHATASKTPPPATGLVLLDRHIVVWYLQSTIYILMAETTRLKANCWTHGTGLTAGHIARKQPISTARAVIANGLTNQVAPSK